MTERNYGATLRPYARSTDRGTGRRPAAHPLVEEDALDGEEGGIDEEEAVAEVVVGAEGVDEEVVEAGAIDDD